MQVLCVLSFANIRLGQLYMFLPLFLSSIRVMWRHQHWPTLSRSERGTFLHCFLNRLSDDLHIEPKSMLYISTIVCSNKVNTSQNGCFTKLVLHFNCYSERFQKPLIRKQQYYISVCQRNLLFKICNFSCKHYNWWICRNKNYNNCF